MQQGMAGLSGDKERRDGGHRKLDRVQVRYNEGWNLAVEMEKGTDSRGCETQCHPLEQTLDWLEFDGSAPG